LIKQRGALLAKGRFVGIQFETLFENGLYMEIAKNAMTCAEVIKKALQEKGYEFLFEPETNQLFPIMPNDKLAQLQKNFAFSVMDAVDEDHTIVRICTSWATKMENVEKLINEL
ncbi:MAG: low specificity L-threonine aldolase, partial [Erysipelotrichaceae bacterium]|nr:low specificity L-threonine aldolase [Erysipelotrichaceae bacterium]